MKPKKEIRLYNVILPIWMLWIVPPLWLIILPANFIIDFTVFYFTLKFMKLDNRFETGKKAILRIWLFGFLSDGIGVLLMLAMVFMGIQTVYIQSIGSFICVTFCIAVSAVCIYLLDLKWGFHKTDLTLEQKKKAALAMAVITAPYLFYVPPIY
ncbi:MAG: hypothetical protein UC961_04020 [Emergencia sp.]|nr:hypothetical protein [Emergencia sp.]